MTLPPDSTGTSNGGRDFTPLGGAPDDDGQSQGGGRSFPPGDYDAFMEHVRLLANPVVASVTDMLQLAQPTPPQANFIMLLIQMGTTQLTAACSWWEIWLRGLYSERKRLQDARNSWMSFYEDMEAENAAQAAADEDEDDEEEEDEEEEDTDEDEDDVEEEDDEDDEDDVEGDEGPQTAARAEHALARAVFKPSDDDTDLGFAYGYNDMDKHIVERGQPQNRFYGDDMDYIESPLDADDEMPLTLDDTEKQLGHVESRIRWLREQVRRSEIAGTYWSATKLMEFFDLPEGERQGKSFETYLPSLLRRAYQEIMLAMLGVGFAHREAVGAQQVLDRWQPSNNVTGQRQAPPMMRYGGGDV